MNAIKGHFEKGVDFLIIDGRALSAEDKSAVIKFLKDHYSKELDRVITVGINK